MASGAYLISANSYIFYSNHHVVAVGSWPGLAPAGDSLSFASPKESKQRKGDPAARDPHAARGGSLRCSFAGHAAELTALLRSFVRTTAASQASKACVLRHTPAPRPALLGTGRRAWQVPCHRCAWPGMRSAQRLRSSGPSAAMARVLFNPFWLRLRRGVCGVGMRVEARMLRTLTRRGCPNEAAQQRSEFHGAPRKRPDAGLPRSAAQGSQTVGRLFFGDFLLAKQKKVTAPPGAHPGQHTSAKTNHQNTHQQADNATRTTAAASTPKNARNAARVSLRPNPSVPSVMKRRPGGTKARTVSGTART